MGNLRAIVRVLLLVAVTAVICLGILAGFSLLWPFPKARHGWRNFIFRAWSRMAASVLGLRIVAQGALPRGGFFLVSNHLSYLDIVVYAALIDAVFIAKSEVAHWPVLGWLCRSMDTLFIDRKRRRDASRVSAQIEQMLNAGRGVLLFPEGTSTAGATVLPFKTALLEQAARAGFAVSHAAINYRVPESEVPAHLSVCWWDDTPFLNHLFQMMRLRRIDAQVTFGAETITATDRKTLAARLHQAVKDEFIPVVQSEADGKASLVESR